MMDEHVCEWKLDRAKKGWYCNVDRCYETLLLGEATVRLNEYDKLKAATEALSVEHVRYFLHQYQLFAEKLAVYTKGWEPLRAYADILEGK